MLKKLALIITILLAAFATSVHAQGLTFDRAYQDYQYNQTVYDTAFSDYQDAKNAYLQGGKTLGLGEQARQKTLTMLQDRDQLMVVYITALRAKISELTGLSSDDKSNIFGKIDTEVAFYSKHKDNYSNGDDLNTLFSKSVESENQYKNTTSLIVQEALFDISLGQVEALRLEHEQVYATLKQIINDGVSAGKLKLDPFNRWLTDIDATDQTLKQNESSARNQIAQIYSQSYSVQGGYDTAVATVQSSVQPLSQFNEFLVEVLNYIKSHE